MAWQGFRWFTNSLAPVEDAIAMLSLTNACNSSMQNSRSTPFWEANSLVFCTIESNKHKLKHLKWSFYIHCSWGRTRCISKTWEFMWSWLKFARTCPGEPFEPDPWLVSWLFWGGASNIKQPKSYRLNQVSLLHLIDEPLQSLLFDCSRSDRVAYLEKPRGSQLSHQH